MGVDIHMHICDSDGKDIHRDIYDGRNSEWFNNLRGCGTNELYNRLNIRYGMPEGVEDDAQEHDFYGFNYIQVGDYLRWFEKYKPHMDAGWVTKHEAWEYYNRNIVPEVSHYLCEDDIIEDMEFIEVIDNYDCSAWLYYFCNDNHICNDAYIYYYFDC